MNLGDLLLGQWDCLVTEDLGMGMLPTVLPLLIGSLALLGGMSLIELMRLQLRSQPIY